VVSQDPDFGAPSTAPLVEERRHECAPVTSPAHWLQDIECIQEHRSLAVGMDQFMAVDPPRHASLVLSDEQRRLRSGQEDGCIELSGQPKELTRLCSHGLVAALQLSNLHDSEPQIAFGTARREKAGATSPPICQEERLGWLDG